MKKYLSEAIGTFALVFAGAGSIIINGATNGSITHVGIALTFGLVIMAMIYTFGEVSGAHFNPAVTIGFSLARHFPARDAFFYIISQTIGALVASALLFVLFPGDATYGATLPLNSAWQSLVLEIVMTFFLMLVILGVTSGSKEKGLMAGIAIGGTVALDAMFGGPISGASMNPARSFGPDVFSGNLGTFWIYLVGPIVGAVIAAFVSKYIYSSSSSHSR